MKYARLVIGLLLVLGTPWLNSWLTWTYEREPALSWIGAPLAFTSVLFLMTGTCLLFFTLMMWSDK